MERTSVDRVIRDTAENDSSVHDISDALGATDVALNWYRLAPDEGFPGGLHAHADQEELFVVLDGTATFETMERVVTVTAGEAVRFTPGEFHSGRNETDCPLVAMAVGAPQTTTDVRIPFACPACRHESLRLDTDARLTFVCPTCETELTPNPCPACGGDDLFATLSEPHHPVAACRDCGATFERPPMEM